MQPIYIREAFRLLQKSIILVENEDIELEDIEEVRNIGQGMYAGRCMWSAASVAHCGCDVNTSYYSGILSAVAESSLPPLC